MTIDPAGRHRGARDRASMPPVLILTSLAMVAGLSGGCVLAPRRTTPPVTPAPSPASPAVAQDGPTPAMVDVTRTTVGDGTTFHETATDRQRFQVHLDFGRVFETQGNFDRAIREYQDALTVAETTGHREFKAADRALAHRRMAGALDRLGRFPQAEDHYKQAMKLGPKDPKIWNDAGYSYYLQGRWAESERALRTALKLAPEDARARTNLGLTLAAAGRTQDALPLLSRSEGDAIGHANLGYLLAATGQFEPARQEYQKALALRPDLDLPRRALVQLDRQQQGVPATGTTTRMSQATKTATGPLDRRVTRASTSAASDIILPPLPPLPTPKLPSRTLP
jgi:Tfp pilus assembly protein PilF